MSDPDPEYFLQFVLAAGLLLNLAGTVVALLRQRHVQKREVSFSEDYVPRNLCKTLHASTDLRIKSVEDGLREVRAELKMDRESLRGHILDEVGKVHNRVNMVLEAVSRLSGEMKGRSGKAER